MSWKGKNWPKSPPQKVPISRWELFNVPLFGLFWNPSEPGKTTVNCPPHRKVPPGIFARGPPGDRTIQGGGCYSKCHLAWLVFVERNKHPFKKHLKNKMWTVSWQSKGSLSQSVSLSGEGFESGDGSPRLTMTPQWGGKAERMTRRGGSRPSYKPRDDPCGIARTMPATVDELLRCCTPNSVPTTPFARKFPGFFLR